MKGTFSSMELSTTSAASEGNISLWTYKSRAGSSLAPDTEVRGVLEIFRKMVQWSDIPGMIGHLSM